MKGLLVFFLNFYGKLRRFAWKLQGKSEADVIDQRIVSGQAWEEFCDSLKSAGNSLVFGKAPMDAFNQAEGVRYLTRLTRTALEAFVENNDPQFPVLKRMVHETVKMGADNPDNYYQNAQIDGRYEYLVRGQRNDIFYLGFFTQNGNYGTTGGLAPCGKLEAPEMEFNADGSFELVLSKEKKGQNWIRIEEESTLFMVRQTFMERDKETPASMTIECIGGPEKPEQLTAAKVDAGLQTAGLFVAGATVLFSKWASGFQSHVNQLPQFDPDVSTAAGGDPEIAYYHSYWQLADDQALVIEATPPECLYWNFQLNNHWMESLDYAHHQIHVNNRMAKYRADGSVRVIVSHSDPGRDNWIETCDHHQGTMLWRWVQADSHPQPECRVVKFSEIANLAE